MVQYTGPYSYIAHRSILLNSDGWHDCLCVCVFRCTMIDCSSFFCLFFVQMCINGLQESVFVQLYNDVLQEFCFCTDVQGWTTRVLFLFGCTRLNYKSLFLFRYTMMDYATWTCCTSCTSWPSLLCVCWGWCWPCPTPSLAPLFLCLVSATLSQTERRESCWQTNVASSSLVLLPDEHCWFQSCLAARWALLVPVLSCCQMSTARSASSSLVLLPDEHC